jgi:hypothetical protein
MPVGRRSRVWTSNSVSSRRRIGLAGPALEQHVVRQDHRGAAVDREHLRDVLHEVELLVARGHPESGRATSVSSRASGRPRRPW